MVSGVWKNKLPERQLYNEVWLEDKNPIIIIHLSGSFTLRQKHCIFSCTGKFWVFWQHVLFQASGKKNTHFSFYFITLCLVESVDFS